MNTHKITILGIFVVLTGAQCWGAAAPTKPAIVSPKAQKSLNKDLMRAVGDGNEAQVIQLIGEGANINYNLGKERKVTPYTLALASGYLEIANLLRDAGGKHNEGSAKRTYRSRYYKQRLYPEITCQNFSLDHILSKL